jgi:transcriptional regulator with XRE-family HTH domain
VAGKRESDSDQASEGQVELADEDDRLELARIVAGRIAQLRLTRKELEKRSGVSVATIREIEHPKRPRKFGRKVLEPISRALEWPPGYLVRVAYRSSSEAPDPIVQAMMTALAPYLEKIDAIPGLQADVAAIKADLGIRVDSTREADNSVPVHRGPRKGSDEGRDAVGLAEGQDVAEPEREGQHQ